MTSASQILAVHADWSIDPKKRWMCIAGGTGLRIAPVGDLRTLLPRLNEEAEGRPIVLGVDFPLGVPRAYAEKHLHQTDFPSFLTTLPETFLDVAETLGDLHPNRPFYPQRGRAGMTRLSHARALGLTQAQDLSRVCDRKTNDRPAGAPLFWTLGANQTGKAAISAWRDLIIPNLGGPIALWPFAGPLHALLKPGQIAIAETYPAEAMRQLAIPMNGSKRRHADRSALQTPLHKTMARLGVHATPELVHSMDDGFGRDAAGEDRLDCLLGLLCVLNVLQGNRPDTAPPDPSIQRWEGWVLGQHHPSTSSDQSGPPAG